MENVIKIFDNINDDARHVRFTVFIKEQGFLSDHDDIDKIAKHIVLYLDGKAVATCRVFESEEKCIFRLGRLAVLREHRNKGFGKGLLLAAEEYVKSVGGKALKLHSQCSATDFYSRLGYKQYGKVEEEQGCLHVWMKKDL